MLKMVGLLLSLVRVFVDRLNSILVLKGIRGVESEVLLGGGGGRASLLPVIVLALFLGDCRRWILLGQDTPV